MARYESEFDGMPALFTQPRGLDPNFRGGYGGMRMRDVWGRAAYGDYRLRHQYELETEGGYCGIHRGLGGPRTRTPRAWEESGGLVDPRVRRAIEEFDARGPRYAGPPRQRRARYDMDISTPTRGRPHAGYEPRYTNRGVTPGGYGVGWAYGAMPGSR
ncbi:MAG: hypothetical protein GEU90_09815 [Gemmatimonas sp.]|nr:hypothetical protein [Gemmatimonas sp.]